ncbi:conserved hypothetical protein [Aeromonas salmonicida]|nr:conserved hypothetical protein [Aeromonas salmonicida]
MRGQAITVRNAYREFRARIIFGLKLPQLRNCRYPFGGGSQIQQLRGRITAFREHLVFHGERMLKCEPEIELFLRMALRIPSGIPLLPTRAATSGQYLMLFLPSRVNVQRARLLLQPVGTFEGRCLIFRLQIKRTILNPDYFSPSLDFALRKLQTPRTREVFHRIGFVDISLMQACYQLGEYRMDEVNRIAREVDQRINGMIVLTLVNLGVIDSTDVLSQLPKRSNSRYYSDEQLTLNEVSQFRQVIKVLQDSGVAPQVIVQLVRLDVKDFDPQRLKATVEILQLNSPELSKLLQTLGEQVMLIQPERWAFLVYVLGIHSVVDIGLFKCLLDSGQTPSKKLALELRAAGADVTALAACQALILAAGVREDRTPAATTKLQQLLAAPHLFTFAQLALAEDYLLAERDLISFLQVLVKHGYRDAQSVLAFQHCYKQLRADQLDSWLNIAGERAHDQPVATVVEWVARAGRGGYTDSFNYLLKAGELRTFTHLKQALKLAPLGATLLRYVREERGLYGLSALLKWYHNDAPGIKDIRLWSGVNAVSKILLDDAFERKNFKLLKSNLDFVESVIDQQIGAVLGPFPVLADDEMNEAYHQKRRRMHEEYRSEVAPRLKVLLTETGGVLVLSILDLLGSPVEEIRTRIAQFAPELSKLLTGNGPTRAELSDLEADLIALVYRTTSRTVRDNWHRVIRREPDVSWLATGTPYSMSWGQTEQQLDELIDLRGLHALKEATQFAVNFTSSRQKDMYTACRYLSPKRLLDPAADVWSLTSHLGVLMAIAGDDSNVCVWLDQRVKGIEQIADPGLLTSQQVDSLHKLFDVQLGDALDVFEIDFVESLLDTDASLLASRLGMHYTADSLSAKDALRLTLTNTRETVLRVYRRWAAKQKKRFDRKKNVKEAYTTMQAFVSKSPAAFFAKEAAGICTRGNTAMWQESRHAHLLVFAPDQKCLAGMALLYFERVPALDADRDTLIIRAINPMEDFLASHGESSIVDSYFDVAISIAQEHDLTAVAFPCPMGMHLMSNHQSIENDINERFMKRARTFIEWNMETSSTIWLTQPRKVAAEFYAYEAGEVLVEELFVIWHAKEREIGLAVA